MIVTTIRLNDEYIASITVETAEHDQGWIYGWSVKTGSMTHARAMSPATRVLFAEEAVAKAWQGTMVYIRARTSALGKSIGRHSASPEAAARYRTMRRSLWQLHDKVRTHLLVLKGDAIAQG